jgi:hypothetical protein
MEERVNGERVKEERVEEERVKGEEVMDGSYSRSSHYIITLLFRRMFE